MYQWLALSLICICSMHYSFGQTDSTIVKHKKNGLHFEYGLVHNRFIDEGYTNSKLPFHGTHSKLRLGYSRNTDNYIFNFYLEGYAGTVRSDNGIVDSKIDNIKPSLEYFRRVKAHNLFGKESTFFVGAHLSSNNYIIENQPVVDNMDIISINGIYLGVQTQMKIDRSQLLQIVYLMPAVVSTGRIIANNTNFTYEEQAKPVKFLFDNSKTSYFNITDLIHLGMNYEKSVSRHISLSVRYNFFFLNSKFKSPVRFYSNELLAGLKIKF